jgi:hypothetical protein
MERSLPAMEMNEVQKRELFENGFVRLPGAVPREKVDRALRAINASLGSEGIDPAELSTFRARSYCPEITGSAQITDLLNDTPLWSVAESAIGEGKVNPISNGQIALRFPTMDDPHGPHPHIDGMYSPDNGVPKGEILNFTALVGVFLSDVPEPYSGNFTVWPGTHRIYEEYFREKGPETLLDGMPPVEMPEPEQVTAKAGDAVLCHYQLAHGIAGNGSPNIRYAIFFRLSHVDHESVRWECMTDIWREWKGMRSAAHAAG